MNYKPLNISEQSYLLMALLFARHSLFDLLEFLPPQKRERLIAAAEKMLMMPRPKRIQKAITELRRLFNLDRYPYQRVHVSWVEDALLTEPCYLRSFINHEAINGQNKWSLAHHCLVQTLAPAPLKTPLYEPALVRLFQIKGQDQESLMRDLGYRLTLSLGLFYSPARLDKFLKNRQVFLPSAIATDIPTGEPFTNDNIRSFSIRFAAQQTSDDFLLSLPISVIAIYLKTKKHPWQETVKLTLEKHLGQLLDRALTALEPVVIDDEMAKQASSFIECEC